MSAPVPRPPGPGVTRRILPGFGPALGPTGAMELLAWLTAADGEVATATSDWVLAAADRSIQLELLTGYKAAAAAMAPERANEIHSWAQRRWDCIAIGGSMLRVGHRDLLLLPEA